MKRFLISSDDRRSLVAALVALTLLPLQSALAAPQAESSRNVAKNLARMNSGAQIEAITPDGRVTSVTTTGNRNQSAAALIMDDDSLSCPLQEGETTFVIKLPATSALDRFTFVNENAEAAGDLKISVSNYRLPAASSKWVDVDGRINFSRKRLFNLSLVGVEARYLKLSFHVQKPGRIAALGLYGDETLERFSARQDKAQQQFGFADQVVSHRLEDSLNFNYANLYAKARVVYVSSGIAPAALRMIDDDNETGFRFSPTDTQPTVIVELAESQRLRRVSARYDMARGRLDVFLLKELNEDPGDLGDLKPIASVTDRAADGKAAVDFNPQGARYVALRWTPESGRAGTNGFEIAEIDAFGDVPLAFLSATQAPDLYASSSSALTIVGGQASPDLSNTLGTLAVPPTLPLVSP